MALRLTDEVRYRILRLIDEAPAISQRALAHTLGISLGKTNFCLKALIERGVLKANRFPNSQNKWTYVYVLANGIKERAKVTIRFLSRKMAEHEAGKTPVDGSRESKFMNANKTFMNETRAFVAIGVLERAGFVGGV